MTAAELIHPISGLWAWVPVAGAAASSVLWPAAWNAGRIVRSWWKEKV